MRERPMRIVIAAVGRLKEGPERQLFERYRDRLAASGRGLGWGPFDVAEVPESRASDAASRKSDEAARLLAKAGGAEVRVALHENGRGAGSRRPQTLARQDDTAPHARSRDSGRTALSRGDDFDRSSLSSRMSQPAAAQNADSFAFSSATTREFAGVAMPTLAPSRGIAPLMLSTSAGRRASWSRSMEGRASGIFSPKART